MYIYIYTYRYSCIYIHMYWYVSIHIYIYANMYVYIYFIPCRTSKSSNLFALFADVPANKASSLIGVPTLETASILDCKGSIETPGRVLFLGCYCCWGPCSRTLGNTLKKEGMRYSKPKIGCSIVIIVTIPVSYNYIMGDHDHKR